MPSNPTSSPARGSLTKVITEAGRLTDRDHAVINLLADHRVMTTDQLARVEFSNVSMRFARRRLQQLAERDVLARFRTFHRPGSLPWRYCLGPVGALLHAARTDTTFPRANDIAARVTRLQSSSKLDHRLGVAEFYSRLHAGARRTPGAALTAWWSETRAATECGHLLRPDGYLEWAHHQPNAKPAIVGCFYEHDRGTEVLDTLLDKIDAYARLTAAGIRKHAVRTANSISRPVLVELPSVERETNFHQAIDRRHGSVGPSGVMMLTTHSELVRGDVGPAGPIWWLAASKQRLQLTDLINNVRRSGVR
ncbi:hypothetical protein GCM10023321_63770 [Pseudonocardia eucalypti]|uniref:Protein involved in plasmid replication-relaxation n=1 Tax=Pseudonocardia eucalypti TaxID=648755 RepID=A0ABP9QXK3_9PSEU|nr:hypothetical protein [Pseudonocardia eucalypti]